MQQILAAELPSINLWYLDAVLVHTKRLGNIQISGSGNFDFLRTASHTAKLANKQSAQIACNSHRTFLPSLVSRITSYSVNIIHRSNRTSVLERYGQSP